MGNTINDQECTDDVGYLISILNGTSMVYVRCSGSVLHLGILAIFNGLKHVNGDTAPEITKQGSQKWHSLRQSAVVTGSTIYSAIGLDRVKIQQEYFDRQILKKTMPMDPEVEEYMEQRMKSMASQRWLVRSCLSFILVIHFGKTDAFIKNWHPTSLWSLVVTVPSLERKVICRSLLKSSAQCLVKLERLTRITQTANEIQYSDFICHGYKGRQWLC